MDTSSDPSTVVAEKETWHLRLYVAGASTKSLRAYANLKRLC